MPYEERINVRAHRKTKEWFENEAEKRDITVSDFVRRIPEIIETFREDIAVYRTSTIPKLKKEKEEIKEKFISTLRDILKGEIGKFKTQEIIGKYVGEEEWTNIGKL